MAAALPYRGPDACNVWVDTEAAIAAWRFPIDRLATDDYLCLKLGRAVSQ